MNSIEIRKGRIVSTLVLMITHVFVVSASAATWYVDSAATGASNGTSWTNAWKNVNQVSGVSSGDIVYISGGPSGSTRTYTLSSAWSPNGGATGNPVIYRIGQDAAHNGTATFNSPSDSWISGSVQNAVVSGDAGDGKMHFQIGNVGKVAFYVSGATNFRISYVNGGQQSHSFFYANGCNGVEIDHCYYYKLTDGSDDNIGFVLTQGLTWDNCKIHDNEFHAPYSISQDGWGDDYWNGSNWSGLSFYNNLFISYGISNYLASQHQDGMQPLGGDHIKVYGNYFQNITNYPVYGDAYYAGFSHFWVYNNIIVLTDPVVQRFNSPQGIAIGPQGPNNFSDVVVANNLIADYGVHGAINLRNNPGDSSSFTSCVVTNNIALNSGPFGIEGTVSAAANVQVNLTNGSGHFVRYAASQANSDFHLVSSDGSFKDKGISLASYFNTDKDGVKRPQGSAWDIGPYEYGGSGTSGPLPPRNLRVVPNR
jgi:hypothetical protein